MLSSSLAHSLASLFLSRPSSPPFPCLMWLLCPRGLSAGQHHVPAAGPGPSISLGCMGAFHRAVTLLSPCPQPTFPPPPPPPRCLCISVCCLLSAVPCPFCTAVCFSVAAFVLCTNHDGFLQKETLSHGGPHRFPSCQALRRCKYPLVLPSPTFAAVLL